MAFSGNFFRVDSIQSAGVYSFSCCNTPKLYHNVDQDGVVLAQKLPWSGGAIWCPCIEEIALLWQTHSYLEEGELGVDTGGEVGGGRAGPTGTTGLTTPVMSYVPLPWFSGDCILAVFWNEAVVLDMDR